ncbi:MAG: FtsP/CotA-like multicopper oxidase with cupredoxin domain [Crocinitomicaceae bacterium]|jgi:FtsP/CotA-like multicopper oxidase with cupredoxin domain
MGTRLLIFLMIFQLSTLFGQADINVLLIARNTGKKVLANSDTIRVFGFALSLSAEPGVPGPTITANEGDSIHIDLWNVSQGAPHTIHLHGLDVDQQNDGVPHLSFEVGHMDHGFYHFKAPEAGTYLYHCHVASTIHVQAGMYGLIIIKPTDGSNTTWNGGFPFTNENSFFLSEIDTNWHTDSVLLHEHDTTLSIMPINIPDFHPQFFLINGLSDQQLIDSNLTFNSAVGQVDYTRLTNIGYCGTRIIFPSELNARIVDSDGRPLNIEEISDTVYVYPGERYGVLTESDVEFQGQITYEYFDLNTMLLKGTQVVPVDVSGFAALPEIPSDEFSFKIVPNPSSKKAKVVFELEEEGMVGLRIVDLTGKVVSEVKAESFKSGKNAIQIGDMVSTNGTFIVQLMIEGLVSSSQTMIRQ